jgi:immunomodulating metalloprotease
MWGVTFSAAASAQVTTNNLAPAEKLLFPMSDVAQSGAGVGAPLMMTATATYP